MPSILKFAVLAGVVAFIAGCERQREEIVVVPPPPLQAEPTYNKF